MIEQIAAYAIVTVAAAALGFFIGRASDEDAGRQTLAEAFGFLRGVADALPLESGMRGRLEAFLEREGNQRFAAHRVRGEWFEPAPELLDFIAQLQKEMAA